METVENNNTVADAQASPGLALRGGNTTTEDDYAPSSLEGDGSESMADDAEERQAEQTQPGDEDGYYKSQKEVDRAFAKRLAAEREKWEREQGSTGESNIPEAGDALGFFEEADFIRGVQQAEGRIRENDPGFDLAAEMERNPLFALMVAQGEDAKKVYDFFNPQANERRLRQTVEREIIQRLRMRNNRPEALRSANAGTVHRDIAGMSDSEIMEIDQRIKRGERVTL